MSEPDHQSESPAPPAKRSWRVRWSLRALIALIAFIAAGLGWVSYQMRVGYMHEEAAKFLLEHGGKVKWKRFVRRKNPNRASSVEKEIPTWISTLGADPMYWRIDEVFLFDEMSPEELVEAIDHISRLGSVRFFNCDNSEITEAQLVRVVKNVELELLSAYSAPIGGGPMPWLRDTKLTYLKLSRTQFSDEAIDDLPLSLTKLGAHNTQITDEGLGKFVRLTNLKNLVIWKTPTSREAIEELRKKMPWCDIDWQPLTNP